MEKHDVTKCMIDAICKDAYAMLKGYAAIEALQHNKINSGEPVIYSSPKIWREFLDSFSKSFEALIEQKEPTNTNLKQLSVQRGIFEAFDAKLQIEEAECSPKTPETGEGIYFVFNHVCKDVAADNKYQLKEQLTSAQALCRLLIPAITDVFNAEGVRLSEAERNREIANGVYDLLGVASMAYHSATDKAEQFMQIEKTIDMITLDKYTEGVDAAIGNAIMEQCINSGEKPKKTSDREIG